MAIENPIVAADSYDRRKNPTKDYQPIFMSELGPNETGNYLPPGGNYYGDLQTITITPNYEGQCMLHKRSPSSQTAATFFPEMYCVVTYEGNLVWSKVDMTLPTNTRGEPWDPMGRND